jgi:uncharacterized protein (TIGR02246 family)
MSLRFHCAARCAALLVGLVLSSVGAAEEASRSDRAASEAAELAAIRATSVAYVKAFNAHDAKTLAELWTVDADCIDEEGQRIAGRSQIAANYAKVFREMPTAKVQVVIDSLRLLSATAAIEDGRTMLEPTPRGAPAVHKYTAVHVKVGGRWLISSVRESRQETASGYEKVPDLEWLIGEWTAEENGVKTVSVCRWVANKSFVERSFTATHANGTSTSGVQIIGFNPAQECICSWNFSADGGHAIGTWTPREKGWQAEVRGVTGEGVPTKATNTLTKLDDDAYVWQSVDRTLAGEPLPDTEEVVLRRTGARQ